MKVLLNCAGAIALLIGIAAGSLLTIILFFSNPRTQGEQDEALGATIIYGAIFIICILFTISVASYNKRKSQAVKEKQEEKRHQELLFMQQQAMVAAMNAQNQPVRMPTDTDETLITRAIKLWESGNKIAAISLLETMPNNPKAQQLLKNARKNS